MEEEPMELDGADAINCSTPGSKENGLHLYPVSTNDSGEGLPYAPADWPNPGDNWRWKVGRRITTSGYFLDRYLYPPECLFKGPCTKYRFKSRIAVEQYIRSAFPNADLNVFFASFSWKVPSKHLPVKIGDKEGAGPSEDAADHSGTGSQFGTVGCGAGNKKCSSLVEATNTRSELMSCDICCSEQGFCRYCCCILCCRTTTSAYGGYSYIRCEARVDGGYICGHIAHIDCGLRAYMAGTVGGSIGLNAEYYCRRCDSRTDLISHVMKLVQTCGTIDSQDDIEKILNVGIRLLHGSPKAGAKRLLHHIKFAIAKLKKETHLEDIWTKEDMPVIKGGSSDTEDNASGFMAQGKLLDSRTRSPGPFSLLFDPRLEALKLEDEVDQILHSLRKSQEYEYRLAEKNLLAQKNDIRKLYERLHKESSDLSRQVSLADSEASVTAVLERVEQIKWELIKLRDMKEVANGFGRTSKIILKEHFGVETR